MNKPSNDGKKQIKRNEKGQIMAGSGALNPAGKNAGVRHKANIIKQAFFETFERLGSTDALVAWANENKINKREFYKMLLSILPKELDVHSEHAELKLIVIRAEGCGEDPTTLTINRDKPGEVEIDKPIKYITDESGKERE